VSKICGIFDFDARTPSAEDAARIRTALNGPGGFTPQTCRLPGRWAAIEDSPEGKIFFQAPDRSVCLCDGRVHNRKYLLDRTGLRPDSSDAELVWGCFRKAGVDGLADVIGDWSACIWDATRHQAILASDYAGIRPLYYHRRARTLYWSSSLADLVRWTGITELDDTYIASFLVGGTAARRSPYAGIFPVPAGHALSIGADDIADRAFWRLPIHEEIRYADERQYEEGLLELFREAVQVRLPAGAPACAELSGGLDSSSVVCMADRLRHENGGGAKLITFSYTHRNSPDERFFREVEQACGVTPCHLELRDYPAAMADRMGTLPELWAPRYQSLAWRMAALGAGVLLTGQFGDFIMGNIHDDTGQVTECLAQGRLVSAARTAYAWARAMQAPIYPILWRGIREAFFGWVPPTNPNASVGAMPASSEDSLAGGLRARFAIQDRELTADSVRHVPPGRRQRFRVAAEVLQSRKLQTPEALQHISYTHPYAHRPLVEFMLTIPARIVVAPEQPRRLMRRAFAGLLPPAVVNRKSKGSYASTYRESFLPLAAALLQDPGKIQVAERGYIERNSLASRLQKFTQGLDCNEAQLRQILLMEFWLRKPTAAAPSAAAAPRREFTLS
jgi:asparagine synthase (glutamine-hydrolysing)